MPRQKSIVTIIRDLVRTEIRKALTGLFSGLGVGKPAGKPKGRQHAAAADERRPAGLTLDAGSGRWLEHVQWLERCGFDLGQAAPDLEHAGNRPGHPRPQGVGVIVDRGVQLDAVPLSRRLLAFLPILDPYPRRERVERAPYRR